MFWKRKKAKLAFTISVLLIVGFLITSLASYFVSGASLRSEISRNALPLTSDNIYSEIQQDLLRPIFISSFMATDTFLRDWVMGGEVEKQQISKYLKESQTNFKTVTSFFVSEKTRTYYHADGVLKKVSPNEQRDIWYFRVRDMKNDYESAVQPFYMPCVHGEALPRRI